MNTEVITITFSEQFQKQESDAFQDAIVDGIELLADDMDSEIIKEVIEKSKNISG